MESSRLAFVIVAALYLLSSRSTNAQNLTAVKCTGKLPSGRGTVAVIYDNDDTIYLFGGFNGITYLNDAVKYSISKDTTEIAGQLPFGDNGGSAFMNKLGDIFYVAGRGSRDILHYFPDRRSFLNVTSLVENKYYSGAVSLDLDTALLFGGHGTSSSSSSILKLNLNTLHSERVAQLPKTTAYTAAIWVEEKDGAYIFSFETVQKYYRSSNSAELLSLTIPFPNSAADAVWDGSFGYLIGRASSSNPARSFVQFNPKTETIAVIPVEGYVPVSAASPIYIEKLNRIYWFGGIGNDGGYYVYHDEIYYVDLCPAVPPPTTTTAPTTSTTTTPTSTTTATPTTSTTTTPTSTTTATPTTTTELPPPTSTTPVTTTRNPLLCPIDDNMPPPRDCPPQEPVPTYFPYPYNCRKFFQCSNGAAICMQCPNGTVWNQELTVCDRESEIGCIIVTTTVNPASALQAQPESTIINFFKKLRFF